MSTAVGVDGGGVTVATTITGEDVTAATGPSVAGCLDDVSAEPAEPTAENSAPTADHARLASSKMATMPTIIAIGRAAEPSSDGGAGRATVPR